MIWQDPVIAFVVLLFTLTTIPMIRAGIRLPALTTLPMVLGGIVLLGCYATLGLWLGVAVQALAVVLWSILLRRSLA